MVQKYGIVITTIDIYMYDDSLSDAKMLRSGRGEGRGEG